MELPFVDVTKLRKEELHGGGRAESMRGSSGKDRPWLGLAVSKEEEEKSGLFGKK